MDVILREWNFVLISDELPLLKRRMIEHINIGDEWLLMNFCRHSFPITLKLYWMEMLLNTYEIIRLLYELVKSGRVQHWKYRIEAGTK